MKKIILALSLTFLFSSSFLSARKEDNTSIKSTLELAIEQDSLALVAFYIATTGFDWTNNNNWLSDSAISTWYGITLNDNGRVSKIELDENNLFGKLPIELGNITELETLSLDFDNLRGTIPIELGNLKKLKTLVLQYNQLKGEIPNEFSNFENIELLDLSNNHLTGSIPVGIGDLKNIKILDLAFNEISGSIPKELSRLSKLEHLYLYANHITGSIPKELGSLNNLKSLVLYRNKLSGTIPNELSNLSNLIDLTLYSNDLSGEIPTELSNLSNLTYLNLRDNGFTGNIPSELGELPLLEFLYLSNNNLVGGIPDTFQKLKNIIAINIDNNEIDSGLENIPSYQIEYVWVHFNKFDFTDFIDLNINAISYKFGPQDSLGEQEIIILEEGEQYTVSSANEHADGNVYIWFKDGVVVPNETSHDLIISNAQMGDEGIYTCSVTNDIAPLLTLYRRPITLTFDNSTNVNDFIKITDEFKIFPNPAINQVTIEFNNSQSIGSIQILDLLGSEVMSLDFNNQNRINIDVSQFMNGYYNIIITSDDKNYHQSLFINR